VTDQVHQIGGIFTVMNRECSVQANPLGVLAKKACADRVKGSGPTERVGHQAGLRAKHLRRNAFNPPLHFRCCPAGESHQHDAARIDAANDQMGNAVGQRVGLT
jgi:hypothetical protein